MSRRQTRRSVSASAAGYLRLEAIARARGLSVSGALEAMAREECARLGLPDVDETSARDEVIKRKRPKPVDDGVASGIFTF